MEIHEIPCLWEKLKNEERPLLLYGMGDGADKIISVLKDYGKTISGVFCSDELYREKLFHSFKVLKYSTAKEIFGEMVVLMSFGSHRDEVIKKAKAIGKEQEFYVPDVPVFGKGIFNQEFFLAHKNEIMDVYNTLEDSHSKKVMENMVNFKLSGKPDYLYPIQTDSNEAYKNIIVPSTRENYLDLGAYDGDTALEFISKCGMYSSITCMEPDRKNFKKLQKNLYGLKNVTLIQGASGKISGEVLFDCKGGRSSNINAHGKETVPIIAIDDLNQNFSYIKIDVEGNELDTILGAKKTIAKNKPKLLISAYHKNEDIYVIPKAVLSINPEYKVYMRHYKYLPGWDTNFYFV